MQRWGKGWTSYHLRPPDPGLLLLLLPSPITGSPHLLPPAPSFPTGTDPHLICTPEECEVAQPPDPRRLRQLGSCLQTNVNNV